MGQSLKNVLAETSHYFPLARIESNAHVVVARKAEKAIIWYFQPWRQALLAGKLVESMVVIQATNN